MFERAITDQYSQTHTDIILEIDMQACVRETN